MHKPCPLVGEGQGGGLEVHLNHGRPLSRDRPRTAYSPSPEPVQARPIRDQVL